MKKRLLIIGFFAYNTDYNGGQENKTRALAELLTEKCQDISIDTIDTLNWKKKPFKLLFSTLSKMKKSDYVIMLPARKGVRVFSKLLLFFKKKNTKLFYSVIGGWLPTITAKSKLLKKDLLRFDAIWVETNSMANDLKKQGFNNVEIIPNFKKINPISLDEIKDNYKKPYNVCTFSRVLEEKGIEDAIDVIKRINSKHNKIIFQLDIYGKIDSNYEERFAELEKSFPNYIHYKGVIPYNDTVSTLKKYFLLLFPTRFKTEGVPGTIIDAYASGVPVLSAIWNSFNDVIINYQTGIGFHQFDNDDFEKKLEAIMDNPTIVTKMKERCLNEFEKYTDDYAFSKIKKFL